MCKAVEALTPEQKDAFDRLWKQLERLDVSNRLPVASALGDYAELSAIAERPYNVPMRLSTGPAAF